jgi:hypothetical protein
MAPSNLLVDFSFRNAAAGGSTGFSNCTFASGGDKAMYGYSTTAGSDPLTWANDNTNVRSTSSYSLNLQFTALEPVAMRPAATTAFNAGVWTGNVSVPAVGTPVALSSDDGAGHRGYSNNFTVAVAPTPPNTSIFSETWESGSLASAWSVTGTNSYRAQITTANGPHGGTRHLTMDASSSGPNTRTEATLTLDLSNRKNVLLTFLGKGVQRGSARPARQSVYHRRGFRRRGDQREWHHLVGSAGLAFPALSNDWAQFTVDLDAAAAAHGLAYNSTFKIRFNQFGSSYISNQGIAIDDIAITGNLTNALSVTLRGLGHGRRRGDCWNGEGPGYQRQQHCGQPFLHRARQTHSTGHGNDPGRPAHHGFHGHRARRLDRGWQ